MSTVQCRSGRQTRREQALRWVRACPLGVTSSVWTDPDADVYSTPDEWIHAGRKISDIEGRLLEFWEEDPPPADRRALAMAMGWVGSGRSVPVLIRALGSEDNGLRSRAAISLGQLGDRRALRPLCKLAENSQDRVVRDNAVSGLGLLGDPAAIPTIERILQEQDLTDGARQGFLRILNDLRMGKRSGYLPL